MKFPFKTILIAFNFKISFEYLVIKKTAPPKVVFVSNFWGAVHNL